MRKINIYIRILLLLIIIITLLFSLFYLLCRAFSGGLILYFFIMIVNAISVIFIINKKQSPLLQSWIVLLLVLPLIGNVLFILFSKSNNQKEYQIDEQSFQIGIKNVISSCTKQIPHKIEEAIYLSPGEVAFNELLESLKRSEKYIYIESYIIDDGQILTDILAILKEKAKMGVDVYIVYDEIGCLNKRNAKAIKEAIALNINIIKFNPIVLALSSKLNYRDHRKIIIIDGEIIFIGGMNIADEYANVKEVFGYWRDSMIKVKSKAVEAIAKKIIYLDKYTNLCASSAESANLGECQIFFDEPKYTFRLTKNVYLMLINQAKHILYITTPYFIIDDEVKNALKLASLSGVDVRIVIPKVPDKTVVYWMSEANIYSLKSNIKFYQYLPGFIHSKMIISDDTVLISSANFDYRSLYTNYEASIIIYDSPVYKNILNDFNNIISESKLLIKEDYKPSFFKRIVIAIVKIFEPLL